MSVTHYHTIRRIPPFSPQSDLHFSRFLLAILWLTEFFRLVSQASTLLTTSHSSLKPKSKFCFSKFDFNQRSKPFLLIKKYFPLTILFKKHRTQTAMNGQQKITLDVQVFNS